MTYIPAFLFCAAAYAQTITPTTIKGPISTPFGVTFTGKLQVTAPDLICAGTRLTRWTQTYVVTSGEFATGPTLYPTDACRPAAPGTNGVYAWTFIGSDGSRYTQYFGVPTSATPVAFSALSQLSATGMPWSGPVTSVNGATGALTLPPFAMSGNYADLVGKPALAPVATSGSYVDLVNKPVITPAGIGAEAIDPNILRKNPDGSVVFPGTLAVGAALPGFGTSLTPGGLNAWNAVRESRAPFSGNMLADFSTTTGYSLTGAGATIQAISTFPMPEQGKSLVTSLLWTIPPGITSELIFPAITQNIPRKVVTLWYSIEDYTAATPGNPILYISQSGYSAYGSDNITLVRNALDSINATSWAESNTPDFGNLATGKLVITAVAGKTVRITLHTLVANQSSLPTVTIIYDDGDNSQLTEALPLLERYGFKAGFSIIASLSQGNSGSMPLSTLQVLYANGHDMLVHGINTASSYATLGDFYTDVQNNKAYLVSNGMVRASNQYVYPSGQENYNTDLTSIPAYLAANGFICAYKASQTIPTGAINGIGLYRHPYYINRVQVQSSVTVASILAAVDQHTNAGMSVVLMAHGTVKTGATGNQTNRVDLDTLLSGLRTRVNAGQFAVVRPSDSARIWGLQ